MKKLAFLMLAFIVLLSSCGPSEETDNDDPTNDIEIYTVRFFDADMTIISEQEVALGEDATAPEDPLKEGYTFNEWSEDFTNVSRDLMIYPIFIPNMYKVSFYSDGILLDEWTGITYQAELDSLLTPSRDGYIFDGWYIDEARSTEFTGETMPSNDVSLYAKWIPETSLATEELYYYSSWVGNSNGNLQNLGLVAYDYDRQRHLYSIGHSVYAYDPLTEESSIVFTSEYAGRATYLNVYGDYLYYIDSEYGYMMRYDLVDSSFEVISDKEYYFLSRNQSYIYALSYEEYYGEDLFVLRYYSENSDSFNTSPIHTIEHLNVYGSRMYYTGIDSLAFELRASNFFGRSTIVDFASLGFESIHQLVLQEVTQDYDVYIGMIASKVDEAGFYLHNTVDGITEVQVSSQLHDLNFDGTYFYYIDGSSLMKVNPVSLEKIEVISVPGEIDFLNIINHWLYYGDYESGMMYRLHPDTLEVQVLSE